MFHSRPFLVSSGSPPVGTVITFHKQRIMPGEAPQLKSSFHGVVVSRDPLDIREKEFGQPARMDYVIIALTNKDFTGPSGVDLQTFLGVRVVKDAVLWTPNEGERVQIEDWLQDNPKHGIWILFDKLDGQAFIPIFQTMPLLTGLSMISVFQKATVIINKMKIQVQNHEVTQLSSKPLKIKYLDILLR